MHSGTINTGFSVYCTVVFNFMLTCLLQYTECVLCVDVVQPTFHVLTLPVAYPGILFGGGFNKFR